MSDVRLPIRVQRAFTSSHEGSPTLPVQRLLSLKARQLPLVAAWWVYAITPQDLLTLKHNSLPPQTSNHWTARTGLTDFPGLFFNESIVIHIGFTFFFPVISHDVN